MYAAEAGQNEVCRFFLGRPSTSIEDTSKTGETALWYACRKRHSSTVDILLSHGTNPDVSIRRGYPLICVASSASHCAIMNLLLAASKQHHDTYTLFRRTPLLAAIREGHEPVVRALLARGAAPCYALRPGREHRRLYTPPLYHAVEKEQPAILKPLFNWDSADLPNILDRNPTSHHLMPPPLLDAVRVDRTDLVQILLDDPEVDPNHTHWSVYHTVPLLGAELNRNKEMVTLLLNAGADPDIPDCNGITPQMLLEAPTAEARERILERERRAHRSDKRWERFCSET